MPPPPDEFDPDVLTLEAGTLLYRVCSNARRVTDFNPGVGSPTRFAFFGDPVVPVLYAAQSRKAALAESLLHDIPLSGGILTYDDYGSSVMGRIETTKDLRLASFMGLGLRRLKVHPDHLTDTEASEYPHTVRWAQAAHRAGFDGLVWMSRRCNSDRAYVLFGDRVGESGIGQDDTFGMLFESGSGFDWLVDTCAPLRVDVMPPSH